MTEKEKVAEGIKLCLNTEAECEKCPYFQEKYCWDRLYEGFKKYFLNASSKHDLRPCIVNNKKKLFHGWFNCAEGELSEPVGVVEDENGVCTTVNVTAIKFTDRSEKK